LTSLTEKRKEDVSIRIIPNPSNKEALIQVPQKFTDINARLKIIDATGKLVFEKNVNTSTGWTKIDASSYKNGIYIIELTSPGGIISQRWIVQH
jgi:hypothetical protein